MIPAPIRKYLDERHVPFRCEEHPLRITAQEIAHTTHISGKRFAKTVVIQLGDKLVLAVLAADKTVDLDLLGRWLGGPVKLAREPEFAGRFANCELGAAPPFGELWGLPVVADAHLATQDWIAFSAGTHTDVIAMRWEDFREVVHPRVIDYGASAW